MSKQQPSVTSQPIPSPSAPPRTDLQFLKLGGSLITDKTQPSILRQDSLARLASEIATAFAKNPERKMVLGHGSGSFGHVPAKKYLTRKGVHAPTQWKGFAEVWLQASTLNRLVVEALHEAGLPVVVFPPSAGATSRHGKIITWDLHALRAALEANLLPVVYGDVVFDIARGGTILSTEDLFAHLARHLHPIRILIAGIEPGVWADYPKCTQVIPEIRPDNLPEIMPSLGGSAATDVTGGMADKVKKMLAVTQKISELEVLIFSGKAPGNVLKALMGTQDGTLLHAKPKN